jgi:hypothetical protein
MALVVLGRSGGGRSAITVKEATTVVAAATAKKDMNAASAKEVAVPKMIAKAVEDVAVAKVAMEAVVTKATEEAAAKLAVEEVMAATATTEEAMSKTVAAEGAMAKTMTEEATTAMVPADATAVVRANGSGGGGPDVVRTDAIGGPDATLDPKAMGKRPAAMTGSSGSPPPQKLSWRPMVCHAFIVNFSFFPSLCTGFLIPACML